MTASRQLPMTSTGTRRSWFYDHGLPPSPPTYASEGEEEDDCGQFKQETVAIKQEVADDFMANLGFGGSTDEQALSPDHPILGHDVTGAPSFGPHRDAVKNWPKLDCELVEASHRAKLFGT